MPSLPLLFFWSLAVMGTALILTQSTIAAPLREGLSELVHWLGEARECDSEQCFACVALWFPFTVAFWFH